MKMRIGIFIICLIIHFNAQASEMVFDEECCPVALQYRSSPISNECMQLFFKQDKDEIDLADYYSYTNKTNEITTEDDDKSNEWLNEQSMFDWVYVGALPHDLYVLYGYDALSDQSEITIAIVKRTDDILRRMSMIQSSGHTAYIENNHVVYSEPISNQKLVEMVIDHYPEIAHLYKRSSKKGLSYYGFWSECGSLTRKVNVADDGIIQSNTIIHFQDMYDYENTLGWCNQELKLYVLNILKKIDANKPDALKEEGVAYSPHCFRLLIEKDLKDNDCSPQTVQISAHKNDPYEYDDDDSFTWEYIGQFKNYYCIYVTYENSHVTTCYEGIYTIEKSNDYLKKIACLYKVQSMADDPYYGNVFSIDQSYQFIDNVFNITVIIDK